MKTRVQSPRGGAALVALTAIAALAVSMPTAAWPQQPTSAENCREALQENYGATDTNVTRDNHFNTRNSIYADATRTDGSVVRFRCLQRKSGVPKVQAFLPAELGSPTPWPHWTDADSFRVERRETAPAEPEAAPEPMPPAAPERKPVP